MSATTVAKGKAVEVFPQLEPMLPGAGTWYADVRRAALARVSEVGHPTALHPDFKGGDLKAHTEWPMELATHAPKVAAKDVAPHSFDDVAAELVFVDGHFVPALSTTERLPKGLRLASLADVLATDATRLQGLLARRPMAETHALSALNAAFAQDGAVVEVEHGTVVERPVHLLFWSTGKATASVVRNLVVAGANAHVTVLETFAGSGRYATNSLTEVVADDSARVEHFKLQRESEASVHAGALVVDQARASVLSSLVVSLGGGSVRHEANVLLAGEGADAGFDGLYVAHDAQFMDHRLRVDHAAPHCTSREVYKGILDDTSRAVFDGKILVRKAAQKTDAKQTNKNLLLSDEALVDSNPTLEIYADDVKCTHGSTTGQLDEEAVFYLRSRGIGKAAARGILTYAFARQVTDRIHIPAVRQRVDDLVLQRLPEGNVIRESLGTEAFE